MSEAQIIDARVNWHGTFDNDPTLALFVDHKVEFGPYEKLPFTEDRISDEQAAIVGGGRSTRKRDGWHLYFSQVGPFATFFTWGGVPDEGFGGYRRSVALDDGSQEEVIGGWHPGSACAAEAGKAPMIEAAVFHDEESWERGYIGRSLFVEIQAVERVVARLLPDVIFDGRTFRWHGRWSKARWQIEERARVRGAREAFEQFTGEAWRTKRDEAIFKMRPYGELGPGRDRFEQKARR